MRVELAHAVVLHRRHYRDTSLLLDVFTREHGRVGLVARGARRPRGRWRGLLEPLHHLRLSWTGRGELFTLTAAEATRTVALPPGMPVYAGFYTAELLLRLLARDDAYPQLFDHLLVVWHMLANGAAIAPTLRLYEYTLLRELGYAPPLTQLTHSRVPVQTGRAYLYHPEGGLRVADSAPGVGEVAIDGAPLLALARGELEEGAQEQAIRRLLNAALTPHLGHRPLKTAQTLQAMQRMKKRT